MDDQAFEDALRRDGFSVIVRRSVPPGEAVGEHSHGWDVRGLVLRGAFRVEGPGAEVQACGAGPLRCGR